MGFDVIGLITVVLAIIGVGVKLELGNRKLGGRVDKLSDELRGEIGDVRRELRDTRAELRGEIKDVRDKLGNEIHGLRGEIKDVRDKLGSEIGALRGEVAKTSTSVARLEGHAFGIPFPDTGAGRGVGQG
ncbi:MAG: hypothetical protein F4X22_06420 [Gemmatimonadales bacterium]|nr:hypothetical protein [Candidatus Palauibacter denitrificans]